MNDSMTIAATSLAMHQRNLEAIASNLSNVNTAGYKARRVSFAELVQRDAGPAPINGPSRMAGGVMMAANERDFATSGDLKLTGAPMDLAINGRGFLQVMLPDGSSAYTRGGALRVTKDYLLATQAGQVLKPEIVVPADATRITIASDGRVLAQVPGQPTPLELGRLELAGFVNPGGLKATGDGLYVASDESGEALSGRAGEDGMGTLVQGALEQSNVRMNEEMVALMTAQRAYELSARVIKMSDEIATMTNDLVARR